MGKVRNLLAFDLGASNGRAILGQFDGERITMRELHRFENNYIEMNGVFYWDTPYLYLIFYRFFSHPIAYGFR